MNIKYLLDDSGQNIGPWNFALYSQTSETPTFKIGIPLEAQNLVSNKCRYFYFQKLKSLLNMK